MKLTAKANAGQFIRENYNNITLANPNFTYKSIGSLIRAHRWSKGESQTAFSNAVGISRGYMSRLEDIEETNINSVPNPERTVAINVMKKCGIDGEYPSGDPEAVMAIVINPSLSDLPLKNARATTRYTLTPREIKLYMREGSLDEFIQRIAKCIRFIVTEDMRQISPAQINAVKSEPEQYVINKGENRSEFDKLAEEVVNLKKSIKEQRKNMEDLQKELEAHKKSNIEIEEEINRYRDMIVSLNKEIANY